MKWAIRKSLKLPLVGLERFLIERYVSRLFAQSELRKIQVAPLTVVNPQSRLSPGLPPTDPLPQLAVGHREPPVQVLRGHLVLIIESHSVGRPGGGGGGTFLIFWWQSKTKQHQLCWPSCLTHRDPEINIPRTVWQNPPTHCFTEPPLPASPSEPANKLSTSHFLITISHFTSLRLIPDRRQAHSSVLSKKARKYYQSAGEIFYFPNISDIFQFRRLSKADPSVCPDI